MCLELPYNLIQFLKSHGLIIKSAIRPISFVHFKVCTQCARMYTNVQNHLHIKEALYIDIIKK